MILKKAFTVLEIVIVSAIVLVILTATFFALLREKEANEKTLGDSAFYHSTALLSMRLERDLANAARITIPDGEEGRLIIESVDFNASPDSRIIYSICDSKILREEQTGGRTKYSEFDFSSSIALSKGEKLVLRVEKTGRKLYEISLGRIHPADSRRNKIEKFSIFSPMLGYRCPGKPGEETWHPGDEEQ